MRLRWLGAVGMVASVAVAVFFATRATEPVQRPAPHGVTHTTCPLDGTVVETAAVLSGTQTGLRLDLRPVGEGALERPIIRCSRCQYVLAPGVADEDELETARRIVDSSEYEELARGSSSHALRGLLLEKLRRGSPEIAFEWLRASWEVENGPPAEWRTITERALKEFVEFAAQPTSPDLHDGVSPLEAKRTAQLMQVELLRRLGRFDEASVTLDTYAAPRVEPRRVRDARGDRAIADSSEELRSAAFPRGARVRSEPR